ncbi:S-adenosylmethionine sensor upstream of mTORC1 isoform X2 [Palaemon carinicauda]
MHELATEHWEGTNQMNVSRVLWIYNAIKQYFHEGELQRITEKEIRKLKHLELNMDFCDCNRYKSSYKIKLLDVGSCYNPFSTYSDLEVTAIDLCPALENVAQCDFLNLQVIKSKSKDQNEHEKSCIQKLSEKEESSVDNDETSEATGEGLLNVGERTKLRESPVDDKKLIGDKNTVEENRNYDYKCEASKFSNCISSLEGNSYDVLVFSLFLEYIPSPKQRFQCCKKAYSLLRPNGILCIITPDSKHQNANVHIYKLWKISLGFLGFSRTKYEKQTHFHGMVFRKGLCKEAWKIDAEREIGVMQKTQVKSKFASIDYKNICSEMYIPQDFQEMSESEEEQKE